MVINILFALLCLVCPLLAIMAYRQGVRDGRAISQGIPLPPLVEPKTQSMEKTTEELNYDISLQNMLDYDGTAGSQKELIKEGER